MYTMLKSMRKSKKTLFLPHFCFPWGRPGAITLNVVRTERDFDAYKLSRTMYPCIFNSFPDIRTSSAKKRHFYVLPYINLSSKTWSHFFGTHCTMLKSMPKSKNRYFYHIFVFPWDALG